MKSILLNKSAAEEEQKFETKNNHDLFKDILSKEALKHIKGGGGEDDSGDDDSIILPG